MTRAKKLTFVGCTLIFGFALIKWWTAPQLVKVNLPMSEPLPDGDYIVGHSNTSDRIRIKKGKTYVFK